MTNKYKNYIPIVILIAFLIAVPFAFSEYYLGVFLVLLINFILVVSYRLMVNIGMWSFAHIPIMGMAAYTAALLFGRVGLPFWAVLPLFRFPESGRRLRHR